MSHMNHGHANIRILCTDQTANCLQGVFKYVCRVSDGTIDVFVNDCHFGEVLAEDNTLSVRMLIQENVYTYIRTIILNMVYATIKTYIDELEMYIPPPCQRSMLVYNIPKQFRQLPPPPYAEGLKVLEPVPFRTHMNPIKSTLFTIPLSASAPTYKAPQKLAIKDVESCTKLSAYTFNTQILTPLYDAGREISNLEHAEYHKIVIICGKDMARMRVLRGEIGPKRYAEFALVMDKEYHAIFQQQAKEYKEIFTYMERNQQKQNTYRLCIAADEQNARNCILSEAGQNIHNIFKMEKRTQTDIKALQKCAYSKRPIYYDPTESIGHIISPEDLREFSLFSLFLNALNNIPNEK